MKKTLFILAIALTTMSPAVSGSTTLVQTVSAQTYTALQPLPCIPSAPTKDASGNDIPGTGVTCTADELKNGRTQFQFSDYVQFMFNLVIAVAASAAVFMIVYGGFRYMTTDSWTGKSEGLSKLKGALWGLLLILTSYMILRTVNPALVAIPTTLVAPLNIDYNKLKDKSSDLLNFVDGLTTLNDQAVSQASAFDQSIIQNVQKLRADNTSLQGQMNDICNQVIADLKTKYPGSPAPQNCDDVMLLAAANPLAYPVEAQEISSLQNKIHDNDVTVATQVGVGTMNAEIIKCAAGESYDDCLKNILKFRTDAQSKIGALGADPSVKTKLDDYARYAALMSYTEGQIENAIKAGSETPGGAFLKSVFQNGAAVVGGFVGGTVGAAAGPVGAGAGAIAAGAKARELATSFISSLDSSQLHNNSQEILNNIQTYEARVVPTITDPDLKATTQAQIDALVAAIKQAATPKK